MQKLSRRNFIELGTLGLLGFGAQTLAGCAGAKQAETAAPAETAAGVKKFKMKFAPRGLFRASTGKDPFKRLKWLSDNGFTAVEGIVFNRPMIAPKQEDIELQKALGKYAVEVGLEMGCISSMNEKGFPTMTANQVPDKSKVVRNVKAIRDCLKDQLDSTFAVLERIGGKTFIIGPGIVDKELSVEKQYDNVVENMKFCADYCARHGYIMEIEPLNTTSHPDMFCDRAELGARIVRDVNNASCRLLYDIFHEQMQMGNLNSLDDPKVWNCIESFHIADVPGRNEPSSGKMPYKQILKKIWDKGYRGFIGLEHGQTDKSLAGDQKLLEIYRDLDSAAS